MNKEHFGIGFSSREGEIMIVTLPLKKWSEDDMYGDILVAGLFEKAKRIAMKNLEFMRSERKKSATLVQPPGVIPFPPPQKAPC